MELFNNYSSVAISNIDMFEMGAGGAGYKDSLSPPITKPVSKIYANGVLISNPRTGIFSFLSTYALGQPVGTHIVKMDEDNNIIQDYIIQQSSSNSIFKPTQAIKNIAGIVLAPVTGGVSLLKPVQEFVSTPSKERTAAAVLAATLVTGGFALGGAGAGAGAGAVAPLSSAELAATTYATPAMLGTESLGVAGVGATEMGLGAGSLATMGVATGGVVLTGAGAGIATVGAGAGTLATVGNKILDKALDTKSVKKSVVEGNETIFSNPSVIVGALSVVVGLIYLIGRK